MQVYGIRYSVTIVDSYCMNRILTRVQDVDQ
jgi:hypothetical protein